MADSIQKTYDYDKFSFIDSNREVSRGHVGSVQESFELRGNFTKSQPLLVNEKMQIIDGQHRFQACKEAGLPIYYTQVAGLGISDARAMNILHKSWGIMDYARSYAIEGDPNYQKFLELIEDYGFGPTITLMYALGSNIKGAGSTFRKGEFVLADEKSTRERLESLSDIGLIVPFAGRKEFALAVLRALKVEGYDQKRMLKKLELHQNLLEERANVTDYLRLLEAIYNFQMAEGNRLRLY